MTIVKITAVATLSAITLSGCALNPKFHETTPVQVETKKGIVTCQLYTSETTIWDRAIAVPDDMSILEGDAICKAEGAKSV